MTKLEDKLHKIPILNSLVKLFKRIKLPGLEGLSFYDLLELYITGVVKGALTSRASAIAFSFFMALFPFLIFILIIIPYVPIDNFKIEFLQFLESFLPPSTSEFFFKSIFENIDNSQRGGLLSSVFMLSIFLMANGVSSIFSAFENSYHDNLSRNMIKQYLYALGVALILGFLLIITIAFLGYFQIYVINGMVKVFEDTGFGTNTQDVLWANMAQYVFFIIMVYLATAILYFFGTREGKLSHFFSIGALFTTVLIILTSYFFGVYIENFAQYNKLYGSIGALLILMFYMWLNSSILLLGHELNISIQLLKKKPKENN